MPHRQRKSPRKPGYDYAQPGMYFVTICTHARAHLFGAVVNDAMQPSALGEIAQAAWAQVSAYWAGAVDVDNFVVMPNHTHAIVLLNGGVTLGQVVNGYKSNVTRHIRQIVPGMQVWQRQYHDHIIRNETALNHIRQYVQTNPQRWQADTFYDE